MPFSSNNQLINQTYFSACIFKVFPPIGTGLSLLLTFLNQVKRASSISEYFPSLNLFFFRSIILDLDSFKMSSFCLVHLEIVFLEIPTSLANTEGFTHFSNL